MPSIREQAEAIVSQYEPAATGRPSVLGDEAKIAKLLTLLRAGNYRVTACRAAGLHPITLTRLMERDAAFCAAVEKAESEAECELIENTAKAGRSPQFWAANMTLLERKHPERWGRRQEDSQTPKVIVQIGVKDSDVQVQIGEAKPTFRPLLSPGSDSESLPVSD